MQILSLKLIRNNLTELQFLLGVFSVIFCDDLKST